MTRVGARALRPSVFFYSVKTQYANAGDALINRELLRHLRTHGEIRAAICDAPAAYLESIRLAPTELRFSGRSQMLFAGFLAALRSRLGLGARPRLVLTPGDPLSRLDAASVLTAISIALFRLAGGRTLRLGVSISTRHPDRLRLEAASSRCIELTGLRDALSLESARRAGFRNLARFPDFALTVPVLRRGPLAETGPITLGISCRFDKFGPQDAARLTAAIETIVAGVARTRPVSLVFVSQVERDDAAMAELHRSFVGRHPSVFHAGTDLEILAQVYRGVDVTISNRLHSLLHAAAQGCLPFGLLTPGQDPKIVGLFEGSGLGAFWADLDRPSIELNLRALDAGRETVAGLFDRGAADARRILAALLAEDRVALARELHA